MTRHTSTKVQEPHLEPGTPPKLTRRTVVRRGMCACFSNAAPKPYSFVKFHGSYDISSTK